MNKVIILVCLFYCSGGSSFSQSNFYGMTPEGGTSFGSIFKFQHGDKSVKNIFSFPPTEFPKSELGGLTAGNNGLLYGLTSVGGAFNAGTIFSLNPTTGQIIKLHDFNPVEGSTPTGSLTITANGVMFGFTREGGVNDKGVLFSFNSVNGTFQKLFDFSRETGSNPIRGLIVYNDKLYGLAKSDGIFGYGTLFSYDQSIAQFQTLFHFNLETGGYPCGNLLPGKDGSLYGLLSIGGHHGFGTIFKFDQTKNQFFQLHHFNSKNGSNPYGSLIEGNNGKFYGLTKGGGDLKSGTIFSYDMHIGVFTKLYEFDWYTTGGHPYGDLLQIENEKFIGLAERGGNEGSGIIFSYEAVTNNFTKLYDFEWATGNHPMGNLVMANNGKLYGKTTSGISQHGVIFSFDLVTKNYEVISNISSALNPFNRVKSESTNTIQKENSEIYNKAFAFANPGYFPQGSLLLAENKLLYGMTHLGGKNEFGTIFQFNPLSGEFNTILDFDLHNNGGNPYGNLIQGKDNKLYGMTIFGGGGEGVLFSLDPEDNSYKKMFTFSPSSGSYPYGSLMQASNENLYGMTSSGGINNRGTIFSYDLHLNEFKKIFDFETMSGESIHGSLIEGSDGRLYGMTTGGGINGKGVLFSISVEGNDFIKHFDFTNESGAHPYGNLTVGFDDKLYGLTNAGGENGIGTLFVFNPVNQLFTKLYSFNEQDGKHPKGSLIQSIDGKLYGISNSGGQYDLGTIFSFNPLTNTFSKISDLNGFNGAFANLSSLTEMRNCGPEFCDGIDNDCDGEIDEGLLRIFYQDSDKDGYGNQAISIKACLAPKDFVDRGGDCDDSNANVNPGVKEVCGNSVDENCNSQTNENCINSHFPRIFASHNSVVEGNYGTKQINFILRLSRASSVPVKVHYFTTDKTATAKEDYYFKAGQVTFAPNTIYQSITILIKGDKHFENTEQFVLEFYGAVNATLVNSFVNGTIINDDAIPVVKIYNTTSTEKNLMAKLKVLLSNPSDREVKVKYDTKNSTAISPSDYSSIKNGEILFKPGETIQYVSIPIMYDDQKEPTEKFIIKLKQALNANLHTQNGAIPEATVYIMNSVPEKNHSSNRTILSKTDIDLENASLFLKIFPNPSQTDFKVFIYSKPLGDVYLRITDVLGRSVIEKQLLPGNSQLTIGENFANGIYFLEVRQEGNRRLIKLIKGN